MSNVVREGVEGIGISHDLPHLCQNSWFTEIAIPETVKIPDVKPDMEELLSVMVEAKIISLRIIKTPEGTSQEGQHLTGRKLSIELELNQKVKYIADEPTQSVHSAHFSKKVSSIWIVVPKTVKDKDGNDVKIETLLAQGKLFVTPYIEDIYGVQLDKRTVFKNNTLLINVTLDCCYGEANLNLTKKASPSPLKIKDITKPEELTYTVEINNIGDTVASNVKFFDHFTLVPSPPGTGYTASYVANSFKINGVATSGDPTVGIQLPNIPACTALILEYKVSITVEPGTTVDGSITNNATVKYLFNPCSIIKKSSSHTITTNIDIP